MSTEVYREYALLIIRQAALSARLSKARAAQQWELVSHIEVEAGAVRQRINELEVTA